MAVSVSATNNNPTHHISLTDADGVTMGIKISQMGQDGIRYDPSLARRSAVDRTAMKTSQGNTEYGDLEPPYYAIAQQDWTGGMGSEELEQANSAFISAGRMTTWNSGKIFPGGQMFSTYQRLDRPYAVGGYQKAVVNNGYSDDDSSYAYVKFSPGATLNYSKMWLRVRLRVTTDDHIPVAAKVKNEAGTTTLGTYLGEIAGKEGDIVDVLLTSSAAVNLTSGTTYRLDLVGGSQIGFPVYQYAKHNVISFTDPVTSANNSYMPNFTLITAGATNGKFFEYKGMPYHTQYSGGTWSIRRMGDRGAADSNAGNLNKLIDATKGWTTNQFTNAYAVITAGKGYAEPQRWRKITGNDTTSCTVTPDWTIEHDTTTEYVIIGTNIPATVASGITNISDVMISSQGVIYIAQGNDGYIKRFREYNNAGTWTVDALTDDGTNKADYLVEVSGAIWRATNPPTTTARSVATGTTPAWGTNITFGGDITVGASTYKITGLENYVDDNKQDTCWVLCEDDIGFMKSSKFYSLQLREMKGVANRYNGSAHITFNTYLYFGLMGRLQRYYAPSIDDVGPNKFPFEQRGHVTALRATPGRLYAVLDGIPDDRLYSGVYVLSGDAWHEVYKAPAGEQINDIYFLSTPGSGHDLMYVSMGGQPHIIWFPSSEFDATKDLSYGAYANNSAIYISDITSGLKDVYKYTRILKVAHKWTMRTSEGFATSTTREAQIAVDYWNDETQRWIEAGTITNSRNAQSGNYDAEEAITTLTLPGYGIYSKRLKFRIRLQATAGYLDPFSSSEWVSYAPIVTAFTVETLARVENKFAYSIPFVFYDNDIDMQNQPDSFTTGAAKIAQLDTWAGQGLLLMRSVDPLLDNKYVFLLPIAGSLVSLDQQNLKRVYTGMLTLQDG